MGADSSKGAAPVDPAVLAKQYDLTVEQVNEAIALWPKGKDMGMSAFKKFISAISYKFNTIPGIKEPQFADALFMLFDTDHSGKISQSEFLGGLGVLAKGDQNAKATLLFKIQGDGMLTKKEFQYALKNSMKAASILMQYQMKKMMEAQAGITFGAGLLAKALAASLAKQADKFVELVFAADKDNTGSLSLDEWLKAYNENPSIKHFMSFATGEAVIDIDVSKFLDTNTVMMYLTEQFPALTDEVRQAVALQLGQELNH